MSLRKSGVLNLPLFERGFLVRAWFKADLMIRVELGCRPEVRFFGIYA